MIFIIMQYTLYVADSLAAQENHTSWFLIFVKSASVQCYVVDYLMLVTIKFLTLLLHYYIIICTFSFYYRIIVNQDD